MDVNTMRYVSLITPVLIVSISLLGTGCAKRGSVKDTGFEATPPPKKEVAVQT